MKYRAEKETKSQKEELQLGSVIGSSQGIEASLKLTRKAASSDASVLITGETGTGINADAGDSSTGRRLCFADC